jgi:hypothetical protein
VEAVKNRPVPSVKGFIFPIIKDRSAPVTQLTEIPKHYRNTRIPPVYPVIDIRKQKIPINDRLREPLHSRYFHEAGIQQV